jgi:PAS domain S-box-containing protein
MRNFGNLKIVTKSEIYKDDSFSNMGKDNSYASDSLDNPGEFFKLLVEFSDDWIYWINPDSSIAYNSPSCKFITGYDASDEIFSDSNFMEKLIHPQYFENLKHHYRLLDTGGNVCYKDFAILTKGGDVKWIHHYCQAVYDNNGTYLGRYVCNKNLSEIQKHRMIFPFDEKIIQQIYDSNSLGYYQIYLTGKIKNANRTFLETLGYNSIEELIGVNIEEHCIVNAERRKIFKNHLLKNGFVKEYESEWIRKDWALVYLKETASIVEGINVSEPFYQSIVEDITEKKLTELATKVAVDNQKKSEKLKTEFLAMISHEIRTPLNVILNFIQMMKNDSGIPPVNDKNELIDIMVEEGERIRRTIDMILEMSQLQSDTYEYMFTEINLLEDILSPIIHLYSEKAQKKSLKIVLRNKIKAVPIYADKQSIMQIFTQLLDNAVKYTQKGNIVITIFSDEESQICVSVSDTGIGITEEYIPHLFSLFSQEDNSYSRMFEGTGIGLALVKKHCDLNKAVIEAKSKKNVGTEFIVTFLNEVKKDYL